ncbi:hypothetical protein NPIL_426881 [Nephila pilipes]|uniref:Uncharacterized protein n=1 Tax=Nephila pilipes TaxID=299642 RepID=A0A8X6QVL7_NEPPI|nr:hypothetical protein NPIL_426881 [Nephila pilipes]
MDHSICSRKAKSTPSLIEGKKKSSTKAKTLKMKIMVQTDLIKLRALVANKTQSTPSSSKIIKMKEKFILKELFNNNRSNFSEILSGKKCVKAMQLDKTEIVTPLPFSPSTKCGMHFLTKRCLCKTKVIDCECPSCGLPLCRAKANGIISAQLEFPLE